MFKYLYVIEINHAKSLRLLRTQTIYNRIHPHMQTNANTHSLSLSLYLLWTIDFGSSSIAVELCVYYWAVFIVFIVVVIF